jgi:hypothetical protein
LPETRGVTFLPPSEARLRDVTHAYGIACERWLHRPLGNGHINDTWLVEYVSRGASRRLVHQRINHHVFTRPDDVMTNIARVLSHLERKHAVAGHDERRRLRLVDRPDGGVSYRDADGFVWRAYHHVPDSTSFDAAHDLDIPREAATAFGRFIRDLADLPGDRLHDTIPGFHDTPARYARFESALRDDPMNRAAMCADAIAFVRSREADTRRLRDLERRGVVPERVVHNDTKLNNVLFDAGTRESLCVVDLDTVMPGLVAYDFGDLVRTAANSAAEDEEDVAKIHVREDVFAALVDGFVAGLGDALSRAEREQLAFSGKLIALECGMRFLTDFLEGDAYFKIAHPFHNLVRARAQFALVASIEDRMDALERIVEGVGKRAGERPSGR